MAQLYEYTALQICDVPSVMTLQMGEDDVDRRRDDVGDVNIFEVTEDAETVTVAGNCVGVTMQTLAKEI